ncbi:MAG: serine/threonine-protein kinase [Thermacetogeniaceae bacterium]
MPLDIGTEVYGVNRNCYRVEGLIGRGAFSELYRIVSDEDGRSYTLKMASTLQLQEDEPDLLANEGSMAPLIDHSNVIRVYYFHDGSVHPGLPPYLIMDYADGGSLQDILDCRRKTGVQFGGQPVCAMLSQLAGGMRAVNEVLIHGDIKPDNILVQGGKLKISDFGLAKIIGSTDGSATRVLQHERYLAPEVWQRREDTILRDMYSVGIVLYELATLQHPYEVGLQGRPIASWREAHLYTPVAPPDRLNPALPSGIARVIERMMAKLPEDRYAGWSEIVDGLEPE